MAAIDFRSTKLGELADDVRSGRLAARELVQGALDRIDEVNGRLNAFVAVDGDAALAAAARIDERVAAGQDVGPLAGIPIGVKDLEDADGFRTTKGSAAFAERPAAVGDSLLVARRKAAGTVVGGKRNTHARGWK